MVDAHVHAGSIPRDDCCSLGRGGPCDSFDVEGPVLGRAADGIRVLGGHSDDDLVLGDPGDDDPVFGGPGDVDPDFEDPALVEDLCVVLHERR